MDTLVLLPENSVIENHGDLQTTSLKVAEAFGKQHKDVIRRLESLDSSSDFNERNFAPVDYLDRKGGVSQSLSNDQKRLYVLSHGLYRKESRRH